MVADFVISKDHVKTAKLARQGKLTGDYITTRSLVKVFGAGAKSLLRTQTIVTTLFSKLTHPTA